MTASAKRAAAQWADRDWEELGRRDPYFAVLTDGDYRRDQLSPELRQRFFATGEGHIAALFAAVSDAIGEPLRPRRALDFGCGVGRALGALAVRCERVVGADVAESMLAEARRVGVAAGWTNVEFVQVDDDLAALSGDFDLIHSALVLQHVEKRRGELLVERLCARLAPGGIAALHVPTVSRLPRWERRLARLRRDFRPLHALLNVVAGRDATYPLMQMNLYDRGRLRELAAQHGARELPALPWRDAHFGGFVLLFRKV